MKAVGGGGGGQARNFVSTCIIVKKVVNKIFKNKNKNNKIVETDIHRSITRFGYYRPLLYFFVIIIIM